MDAEEEIRSLIKSFSEKLPHFHDGRIDYTHSDTALVITIFICLDDKVLLLKRSDKVLTYKGKWNTVAGYLDELCPIREKVSEELSEELGITENDFSMVKIGASYTFFDPLAKKTWIVYPVKVELDHNVSIVLDWEHTEYTWIKPEEIDLFDTVPNAKVSLKKALDF
ncbi:MAG: NUDIX domain-containing protein [Candidatus Thermoplasmatota archaeon]|nr:NUDIX domain-containing protein [Candidatus Thermoplasmatota archaeon]